VEVLAADVLHIFERRRPMQWRGLPWLTAVLTTLYELDELTDATLVRQKAAQAIGWIVEKTDAGALPAFGGMTQTSAYDSIPENAEDVGDPRIQTIVPGGIHYLRKNEKFIFAATQDIGDNFTKLLQFYLRGIAGAADITYEQLTGDLRSVNFSSIRAGLGEFRKRLEQIQQLVFVSRGLQPLAMRFKELASIYTAGNYANATVSWVLPKLHGVDPHNDAKADLLEIRAGLSTLQDKLIERGKDFDAVVEQLAIEQGLAIILESNPANEMHMAEAEAEASDPAEPDAEPASGNQTTNSAESAEEEKDV
jgi:lambda family phage portal protein